MQQYLDSAIVNGQHGKMTQYLSADNSAAENVLAEICFL